MLTSLNIHSWVWLWSWKSTMGLVHLRHNAVWSNTSLSCNSVFYLYSYYTMFHMLCQRDTVLPGIHFSGSWLIFLAGNVWHRRSQASPSQLQGLLHSTERNIVICCVYVRMHACDNLRCSVLAVCPIEFSMILRDSLEVLYLNDNQLECVPQSVCGLHSLTELYLSKWVPLRVCQPSLAHSCRSVTPMIYQCSVCPFIHKSPRSLVFQLFVHWQMISELQKL